MKKAFTLIELLVVIAIIAILAAILFPVFAQAKLAAKKTQDLSNIKQSSLGIILYTGDYDDTYPLSYFYDVTFTTPYSDSYAWSSSLCVQPYIKTLELFKSPADSFSANKDAAYYGIATSRKPAPQSFLSNATTPAYAMFGVSSPSGLMPVAPSMPPLYGATTSANTVTTTTPQSPADIVLLTGGNKELYDGIFYCGEWINNEIGWCYSASYGITEQWQVDALTLAVPGSREYNGFRKFSGVGNVAFGDGHAKGLRPGDLRDPKRWVVAPAN